MWKNTLASLSFAASISLEAVALAALIRYGRGDGPVPLNAVGAHALGLAAGLAAFLIWWPGTLNTTRHAMSILFIGLCAPIPLVGLLFMTALRLLLKFQPSQLEKSEYVLGNQPFLTTEKPDHAEFRSPQSVLEILSGTNESLRRTAIVALRSVDPKKSLPLLRKAIQDSDEQVRLLAQTQFNRILAKLEGSVKRMENDIANSPPDANHLLVLAEHYHELVHLAVSSQETESIYLDRAIALLTRAVSLEPRNCAALFLLLKCRVKRRDLAAAKRTCAELKSIGFSKDSLAPWEAELSFLEHDWTALRSALQDMDASDSSDPRLNNLIEFWLKPANSNGGRT